MLTKKEILNLITNNKTKKAIDALLEMAYLYDDDIYQEVVLQSGKYEQYKRDERSGVKHTEGQEVKLNRINNALIEIVQKLPKNIIASTEPPPIGVANQKLLFRNRFTIAVAVVILLVIGLGGVFLLGVDTPIRDGLPSEAEDSVQVNETSVSDDIGITIPQKKKQPLFDTITVVVNTSQALLLIDNQDAEVIEGSTSSIRRLRVPKEAKTISLVSGSTKCTKPLKSLGKRIYQNKICH